LLIVIINSPENNEFGHKEIDYHTDDNTAGLGDKFVFQRKVVHYEFHYKNIYGKAKKVSK